MRHRKENLRGIDETYLDIVDIVLLVLKGIVSMREKRTRGRSTLPIERKLPIGMGVSVKWYDKRVYPAKIIQHKPIFIDGKEDIEMQFEFSGDIKTAAWITGSREINKMVSCEKRCSKNPRRNGKRKQKPGAAASSASRKQKTSDSPKSKKTRVSVHRYSHKRITGSKAQVMHGTAHYTKQGLTKRDLAYNKHGRIVLKKASPPGKVHDSTCIIS